MTIRDEEAEAIEALESTGNYRVLRRAPTMPTRPAPDGVKLKVGLFVDCETTGLDPATAEVIEIAAVQFLYGSDGEIYGLGETFHQLQQPSAPILAEIVALTGLTDADVEGKTINLDELDEFIALANFVVAHHASFDRKFVERLSDQAELKPWGCSMEQIPWRQNGYDGRALSGLLLQAGYFYERHRAVGDCLAGIHLLTVPLVTTGKTAMAALRETAAKPTHRLYAERAPFEKKDLLKARGYKWNDGANGKPKAWHIDVAPGMAEPEGEWLATEVYSTRANGRVDVIDFYSRFSVRE